MGKWCRKLRLPYPLHIHPVSQILLWRRFHIRSAHASSHLTNVSGQQSWLKSYFRPAIFPPPLFIYRIILTNFNMPIACTEKLLCLWRLVSGICYRLRLYQETPVLEGIHRNNTCSKLINLPKFWRGWSIGLLGGVVPGCHERDNQLHAIREIASDWEYHIRVALDVQSGTDYTKPRYDGQFFWPVMNRLVGNFLSALSLMSVDIKIYKYYISHVSVTMFHQQYKGNRIWEKREQ